MRPGLAVSAFSHAVILAAILIGFGKPARLAEPAVDAITVDLVPLSDISTVRAGAIDSTVVETPAPAMVEDKKPAELAKPTGNTEEDQPTPERSDEPTPAPTVETAPAPAPEPVERPEPKPEPAPPPAPAPTPEPAPEPEPAPPPAPEAAPEPVTPPSELAATPTVPDEQTPAAPLPDARPNALADKRAAFKKQQEAERKAAEARAAEARAAEAKAAEAKAEEQRKAEEANRVAKAEADAKAAKAADEISQLINAEDTRGAKTGEGGSPALGKTTGQAATLTQSDIDALIGAIDRCLSVPIGARENGTTAQLMIAFNADGSVRGSPTITRPPASALEAALGSAAIRAVLECGPYQIVQQKYDLLAEVQVIVDPSKF